jgi:hypothetical protein
MRVQPIGPGPPGRSERETGHVEPGHSRTAKAAILVSASGSPLSARWYPKPLANAAVAAVAVTALAALASAVSFFWIGPIDQWDAPAQELDRKTPPRAGDK